MDSAARQFRKLGLKPPKAVTVQRPPIPDAVRYLWEWFCEISMGLASNGMGPPTVTWESLLAWRCQMGTDPEPWEARALVRLGSLRAEIISEQKPSQDPPPKKPRENTK